jgi:1-acyl-sn-glycerol-3-phosphate acyltransferase
MTVERDAAPYPRAFRAWQFPLLRAFGILLLFVLGRFKTFNRNRVPQNGGLLILSNHRSDCDPIAIQVACPRPIRFMGKKELWDMAVVRGFLNWLKAFPINRGEPDKSAIKHSVALLQAGECVGVFPEGQLTETGELLPLKPGIALIVRLSGAPVICLGLRNTERIVPYGSLLPRPSLKQVTAHWGEPRCFERHADTEQIMAWAQEELTALCSENPNA